MRSIACRSSSVRGRRSPGRSGLSWLPSADGGGARYTLKESRKNSLSVYLERSRVSILILRERKRRKEGKRDKNRTDRNNSSGKRSGGQATTRNHRKSRSRP